MSFAFSCGLDEILELQKKYLIGYVVACKIFLTELLNVLSWILCVKFCVWNILDTQ